MYESWTFFLCTWLMVTLIEASPPLRSNQNLKSTIGNLVDSDFIVETPTIKRSQTSSWSMFGDFMPDERVQFSDDINFGLPSVIYAGIDGLRFRWPGGVIPIEVTRAFDEEELTVILRALLSYQKSTCIRFVDRDPEKHKDYVRIQKGNTPRLCNSDFGLITGKQVINLGAGCAVSVGVVIHELMHTIGFLHEQSRSDRDSYVSILWDNIEEENKAQFEIWNGVKAIGSYDLDSIMHYSSHAFSKNGLPTIQPHDRASESRMGNRAGFSNGDIGKINSMYKCHLPRVDRKELYVKEKRAVNLYRCKAFGEDCWTDVTDEGFPTDSTDEGSTTGSTDDGSDGGTSFGQTGRGGYTTDRTDRGYPIDSTDRCNPFGSTDRSNPFGSTGKSYPTDWTDRAGLGSTTDRRYPTYSSGRADRGYSFDWSK